MAETPPKERTNIVLIGFMASGKSVVGQELARRTGRKHVDLDDLSVHGSSIEEVFAGEGEAGFRKRERAAVERVSRGRDAVISAGGGTVLDPRNVASLKRSGTVVYLKVGPDELTQRLNGTADRPLLRGTEGPLSKAALRKRVKAMLGARSPLYEQAADHVVVGGGRTPVAIAADIERALDVGGPRKPKRVRVGLTPPYNVLVGRGLLGATGELVKLPRGAEKAFCVSHPRIRRLWGDALERGLRAGGLDVVWWTFPEGEEHKTLATADHLLAALARAKAHRDDVVVALGGGVVGDVAGFAASTYARGIGVVQVATTLLAMVDSAIGGKTGVNLAQAKNVVGTFHQPLGVIADLDVLTTLPERELRGGLAEVVKYSFTSDPELANVVVRERDAIFQGGSVLATIVGRCASIKAKVVATDERDQGVRATLNYGHTLGHAIEALSVQKGTRKLHHGEAVAIGMVFAAAVAERNGRSGLIDAHRRVLNAVGLPTTISGLRWSEVRERMEMDKKYARGVRMVLLDRPGVPVVRSVGDEVLREAYAEVARS